MRLLKEIRSLFDNYHLKSGIYHYYRGEYKPAVEFFRKALEADEDLTPSEARIVRYYLTMTLMESAEQRRSRGQREEACEDFQKAVEVSPKYPDIRFRLGSVLEELDRLEDAVEEYRQATVNNPRYLEAWVRLGFGLVTLGRLDEASEAFGKACDIKTAQTREPFDDGVRALGSGDVEAARTAFHLAFLFDANLYERIHREALESLKAEKFEKALEALDAAIEINPSYPDLYNFRGITLCELGREAEAVEAFDDACRLNPRFMAPRLNRAFARLRAGQYKEAEAELEAILEADPTEPAAKAKLAELRSTGVPEKRRSQNRGGVR